MATTTLSKKYQVVIPKEIRKRMRLSAGETVTIHALDDDRAVLVKHSSDPVRTLRGLGKDIWRKLGGNAQVYSTGTCIMALIGLDTCVWIYLLEDDPRYAHAIAPILESIRDGKQTGVFSALGMIEILTGPKKLGRFDLAAQYEQHLRRFPNLSIIGLTEKIVWLASDLRATYNIKTPDAVHLATAIDAHATVFVTNDRALKKVKEIRIELL